jgi:flagellar motility protein MotE (MotC chaperone)
MSSNKNKVSNIRPATLAIVMMLLFAIFFSCNAFSQQDSTSYPIVTVIDGDTVTIFNLEQAKELTARNEERKDCLKTNAVMEEQLVERDTTIANLKTVIVNQNEIEQKYQTIIEEKNDLNAICETEKVGLKKEVKRQKRRKIFAIIGGALGTGLMTTLWITK